MTDLRLPGSCTAGDRLKAYLDGELNPLQRWSFERHLRGCAACREDARIMEAIGTELGALQGEEAPPEGLRERVLSGLEFEGQPAPVRRPFWRLNLLEGLVAGGIVVVLAVVLFPAFSRALEAARRASPATASREIASALNERREDALRAPKAGIPAAPVAGTAVGGGSPAQDYDEVYQQRQNITGKELSRPFSAPLAKDVTPDDIRKYTYGQAIEEVKRKVMQDAALSVQTARRLEEVQDEISARVKKEGGFVENSSLDAPEGGERVVSMEMRIPVERFEATVAWLSGLGTVRSKNVQGQDVTGQWLDERQSVKDLRQQEADLQAEQRAAKTDATREKASHRLRALRPQIRETEQQFAYTSKLAALAHIQLTLTEPGKRSGNAGTLFPGMGDTWGLAVRTFLEASTVPVTVLIWLVVFAPFWLPGVLVFRWVRRTGHTRRLPGRRIA